MRALIVDDNKADRDALRGMLESLSGIKVAGEAANLTEARRLLANEELDVVFLDVELGRENGFDLLEADFKLPPVVLSTVHNDYGGQAFDADAVDYITKPITEDRLLRALHRAATARGNETRSLTRVPIHRSGSARYFLALETIFAITAESNYSRVFCGSRDYPDHRRLREWEKLLEGLPFERLDRSTLLRIDQINFLRPQGTGAMLTFQHSQAELPLGRTAYERLKELLEKSRTPSLDLRSKS
jgi:DNA-binding LytR/AlgR family response regulator